MTDYDGTPIIDRTRGVAYGRSYARHADVPTPVWRPNATVARPVTIYYAGRPGSAEFAHRLDAGDRVELVSELGGLARIVYNNGQSGPAIIDRDALRPDEVELELQPAVHHVAPTRAGAEATYRHALDALAIALGEDR